MAWMPRRAKRLVNDFGGDGILPIASSLIAAQSVARTTVDLEVVLNNAPGRIRQSDEAMALLLALFLVARAAADGGAQIHAGPCRFGDHLQGLANIVIEPDASLGDFSVDFLVIYTELGPNRLGARRFRASREDCRTSRRHASR